MRLTGGDTGFCSGTPNMCGPCDRRPGSLLFRLRGGSSSCIALAIASLLAGKIDHTYHIVGTGVFALLLILMPPTVLDSWLFCLFLVSGLLDELELGGMARGLVAFFNRERLWTPLAALLAFVMLGAPLLYLLALVAFDAAYRFGGWLVDFEFGAIDRADRAVKTAKRKKA